MPHASFLTLFVCDFILTLRFYKMFLQKNYQVYQLFHYALCKGVIMNTQAENTQVQAAQAHNPQSAADLISHTRPQAHSSKRLDISSLVLVAILLAAGCILDLFVAKALAIAGIQPEFVIASFCLAILLTRARAREGIIIGLLAATIIQINTSIPGLEYACDIPAALICALLCQAHHKLFPKDSASKLSVFPFVVTFITTVISGGIFATAATLFFLKLAPAAIFVMAPIVLGTALANAIVVAILYQPLRLVLNK